MNATVRLNLHAIAAIHVVVVVAVGEACLWVPRHPRGSAVGRGLHCKNASMPPVCPISSGLSAPQQVSHQGFTARQLSGEPGSEGEGRGQAVGGTAQCDERLLQEREDDFGGGAAATGDVEARAEKSLCLQGETTEMVEEAQMRI